MRQLLLGLVLFFGMHSMSIAALPLRDKLAAKSELGWKSLYGVASLIGIVLMVRGYADLRQAPTLLYVSPSWLHQVAAV
ncbi:MAG: NnrU family protein, partial [Gammaproteobacteria bacterium]